MDIDTSGFYSKEHNLRAGSFVIGPGFELRRDLKDTYTYPVNGWYWFDSVLEAERTLDLDLNRFNLDLPEELKDLINAFLRDTKEDVDKSFEELQ